MLGTVVVGLGILLKGVLPGLGYDCAVVSGHSMDPTYRTGDVLLVERSQNVRRGDIVVFETGPAGRCVKRVSAERGEASARISGRSWAAAGACRQQRRWAPKSPVHRVPLAYDELFVEGDNPASSQDSRAFGPIQRHQVVGKVVGHVHAFVGTSLAGLALACFFPRRRRPS